METKQEKKEKQTKKQTLLNLMSKPMGVKLTTLVDNLGWQKHTTLGFISILRKQGYKIHSIKGKNGTVYKLEKLEVKNGSKEPMASEV